MSTKRQKHRGIPSVNSISNKGNNTQRMIGNYVLHPRKGWRKVTVVDMLAYQNQIQAVMNTLIK